jgi:hypothetical protein
VTSRGAVKHIRGWPVCWSKSRVGPCSSVLFRT